MKSFIEQAQVYAQFHQALKNMYTHFIGIPLILLSLMILLGFVKIVIPGVYATNLACLATLALLVYYFILEWQLAACITPVLFFMLWVSHFFSYRGPTSLGVWVFFITFVVGWGLQFYGHYLEEKKPAFMYQLNLTLIAPLYIIAEALFMSGYMLSLHHAIHHTVSEAEDHQESEPAVKKTRKKKDMAS